MIHDATVEVTCDGEGCPEHVFVNPEYLYRDYSGKSGFYDCSDEAIGKKLVSEHGWQVADDKQFCEGCATPEDEAEEED